MNPYKSKKAISYGAPGSNKSNANAPEAALPPIFAKANALNQLNAYVNVHLDEHLKKFCQVANIDRNKLIILTASGNHATQLRYLVPDLLRKFKNDSNLARITEIQIMVRPPVNPSMANPRPRKIPLLSQQTATLMRDIAESCEDPTLKEALLKIARNTR